MHNARLAFQFLIGKVKTWLPFLNQKNLCLFQFLIGKVKTWLPFLNQKNLCLFQFLIGKVKTLFWRSSIMASPRVSIPHR